MQVELKDGYGTTAVSNHNPSSTALHTCGRCMARWYICHSVYHTSHDHTAVAGLSDSICCCL